MSDADDYLDGNGTGTTGAVDGSGTMGDGSDTGDEDDHDPAKITVIAYDLALVKVLDTVDTNLPVMQGDDVTFSITVSNQGTVDADDIVITDYIPADMTLNDADWTANASGTMATYNLGALAISGSQTIDITLTIDDNFQGNFITNRAEISDDDAAETYGSVDVDSTPNATPGDDNQPTGVGDATDDTADQNGKSGGDEDDHDPAGVPVGQVYDLALTKVLSGTQTHYVSGDTAVFTINVMNQGTLDADDVEITDYMPAGLTLNDPNWTDNANGTATYDTLLSIPAMSGTAISIAFIVDGSVYGEVINWAEISQDNADDYDTYT